MNNSLFVFSKKNMVTVEPPASTYNLPQIRDSATSGNPGIINSVTSGNPITADNTLSSITYTDIPQPVAVLVTVPPALPLPVLPAPLPVKCGVAVGSFIVALVVVNISQVGCIVLGWFVAWYCKWPEIAYPFCMGLGWILMLLILTGFGIIKCQAHDSPLRWIIRILVLIMMISACIVSIVKFAHGDSHYSSGIAFFGIYSLFQAGAPPSIVQCAVLTWKTLATAPFHNMYSRLILGCCKN